MVTVYMQAFHFVAAAGFKTVLKRIAEVWRTQRADIKEQSADTMRQLAEATQSQGTILPCTACFSRENATAHAHLEGCKLWGCMHAGGSERRLRQCPAVNVQGVHADLLGLSGSLC